MVAVWLQCVAVCCSTQTRSVRAVCDLCCSVIAVWLKGVAVCCGWLQYSNTATQLQQTATQLQQAILKHTACASGVCFLLQCCCGVNAVWLQCDCTLQYRCSVLQCVAVCCSVLHCDATLKPRACAHFVKVVLQCDCIVIAV